MMGKNTIELDIEAKTDSAIRDIKKLENQIKKLDNSSESVNKLNKSFVNTRNSLAGIATSIISFNAISGLVDDFKELESGMIGFAKTTGLADKELKELDEDLVLLSQRLRGVSYRELQGIAEAAGQLGISGKKIS